MNCSKKRFQDRSSAKKWKKQWNLIHEVKMGDVYYCSSCLGWHLTSKSKQYSRNLTRHFKNKK